MQTPFQEDKRGKPGAFWSSSFLLTTNLYNHVFNHKQFPQTNGMHNKIARLYVGISMFLFSTWYLLSIGYSFTTSEKRTMCHYKMIRFQKKNPVGCWNIVFWNTVLDVEISNFEIPCWMLKYRILKYHMGCWNDHISENVLCSFTFIWYRDAQIIQQYTSSCCML
jgi:hypothetical protein